MKARTAEIIAKEFSATANRLMDDPPVNNRELWKIRMAGMDDHAATWRNIATRLRADRLRADEEAARLEGMAG